MKPLGEVLKATEQFFHEKGWAHPRRQAQEVLGLALSMKPLELYMHFDQPLMEEELTRCREILQIRLQKRPLAYIAGRVTFLGCELLVNDAVLIPRPETELLVDRVIAWAKERGVTRLLDLCCGSGCIAIALKKQLPEVDIVASDLSAVALDLARQNAANNGVQVAFYEGDLFQRVNGHFEGIICNPPYLSEREFAEADEEVSSFEPKMALLGGVTGLEFYERLSQEAPSFLQPGGRLWLEIGYLQGKAVPKLFQKTPWAGAVCSKDWSGHDRFVEVAFQGGAFV